jgi:hypothetical protein
MMLSADDRIRRTFHEMISVLLGLAEVYEIDDAFIDHAADEIEAVLRRGLETGPRGRSVRGKLALERLLDELEAAGAAAND